MPVPSLLIRADASGIIGTGHVMRCLALAQAWQDLGGTAVFAMAENTSAIQTRLRENSCEVFPVSGAAGTPEDWEETIGLARLQHAEWVVVDGYQFKNDYQQALKAAGLKVLFLDDYGHASHYSADVVLNQNLGASEPRYEDREPQTRLLLGPRYSLLRREFSVWRNWKREISSVGRRVLVTMGGSDPENVTARAIEALSLAKLRNLEVTVVVGGSNPNFELLQRQAALAGGQINVRGDVSNMPELMSWADVALSAAGSICWELCLLGLPALLVDVAPNQTAVARELQRLGCAVHLGNSGSVSAEKIADQLVRLLESEQVRSCLSGRSRELVDGEGAVRVISRLRSELRLRPAQEGDSRLLWEWANDPQVRALAFSADRIPWEQHEPWFASKMKDPDCRILIAEDGGKAVGQFRVDWRSAQDGEIDVSVSRDCRGRGYGARLIDLGVEVAGEGREDVQFHAFVRVENEASLRAFETAGFRSLGEEQVNGHLSVHYVRASLQNRALRSR